VTLKRRVTAEFFSIFIFSGNLELHKVVIVAGVDGQGRWVPASRSNRPCHSLINGVLMGDAKARRGYLLDLVICSLFGS